MEDSRWAHRRSALASTPLSAPDNADEQIIIVGGRGKRTAAREDTLRFYSSRMSPSFKKIPAGRQRRNGGGRDLDETSD